MDVETSSANRFKPDRHHARHPSGEWTGWSALFHYDDEPIRYGFPCSREYAISRDRRTAFRSASPTPDARCEVDRMIAACGLAAYTGSSSVRTSTGSGGSSSPALCVIRPGHPNTHVIEGRRVPDARRIRRCGPPFVVGHETATRGGWQVSGGAAAAPWYRDAGETARDGDGRGYGEAMYASLRLQHEQYFEGGECTQSRVQLPTS